MKSDPVSPCRAPSIRAFFCGKKMIITPVPAVLPIDFYVYEHRRATTGEVFYVGKGLGRRAFSTKSRSSYWQNIAAKDGLIVNVVQDGLQEWAAFELEQDLIALHGRSDLGLGPLVNMTDGGDGFQDIGPTARQAHRANTMLAMSRPDTKEKHRAAVSLSSRLMHSNPEFRERRAVSIRIGMAKPDAKLRHRTAVAASNGRKARVVCCVETGQVFRSIELARQWIAQINPKASKSPICLCCGGRLKSAYGYTWRYAE